VLRQNWGGIKIKAHCRGGSEPEPGISSFFGIEKGKESMRARKSIAKPIRWGKWKIGRYKSKKLGEEEQTGRSNKEVRIPGDRGPLDDGGLGPETGGVTG